ncbi:hypothetical protein EDB80DRAFT_884723 [Ilyonectria destructans]|nr:hypothetical protein EDB80DRAFT_900712 [Ilyonectria destructans]KAH7021842.1 hypothetical protein EDB80DRAFT_884723 [Ilyonectria destructans]
MSPSFRFPIRLFRRSLDLILLCGILPLPLCLLCDFFPTSAVIPRLSPAQKKAAAAARAEAQRAKTAAQQAADAAAQAPAGDDGSEEAVALAPPPIPASLREASKIFDPKKVGGYRPILCLRCAQSILTCALPGRFCFAYGSSGRYAHCVKGKHTCLRPADAAAELVVPAKYLSLALLQWYYASISAPGPLPRPEKLVKVGETFSRCDQCVIAACGGV